MKNGELIHIKFDYEEALQSKRDILYVEKSLVTISSKMEKYLSLRIEELKTRLNLHKKAKELTANIRKIQRNTPSIEFSRNSDKEDTKEPVIKKREYSKDIESQLQEIQEKLNELQN